MLKHGHVGPLIVFPIIRYAFIGTHGLLRIAFDVYRCETRHVPRHHVCGVLRVEATKEQYNQIRLSPKTRKKCE